MIDVLRREGIYLWYYFLIQLEQIFPYWALGILLGSFVSVFGRGRSFFRLGESGWGCSA